MHIVDTNVLINAVNVSGADHRVARGWLDVALSGAAPVGFAWIALLGFVRIATRPGIFGRPLSAAEAMSVVEHWLAADAAHVVHPTARHASVLATLLAGVGTAGNLTGDAHLGALAIEHRGRVVSFDSDFDRLPGVRWERPRVADG